ncbi:MAG TPA: hypothetical protein VK524_06340 [Polyangiaceae bacterium]|nr:hypothetical protein [Polyangiaceae bacterium]
MAKDTPNARAHAQTPPRLNDLSVLCVSCQRWVVWDQLYKPRRGYCACDHNDHAAVGGDRA